MILVLGLAVAIFLPIFTWTSVEVLQGALLARADASPILLGTKGNELDLTLSALYFRGAVREPIAAGVADEVEAAGRGRVLPLHVGHTAAGAPVVGTDLGYLDARGLRLHAGRTFAQVGEVVAGAAAAHASGFKPGDRVRADQSNLYNLDGAYPLLLEVVGVLAPSGGPDDDALFTDVKTTWALDGFFHGHRAVTGDDAVSATETNIEASAALFLFDSLDAQARQTFHGHGDRTKLPLTAILVLPSDGKARDLLLGDFALEERWQAVRPPLVMRSILDIVLRLREGLLAWLGVVAVSAAAFFALVIDLSLRLRAPELRLIERLGGSRGTVARLVVAEIGWLVLAASALAGGATWVALGLLKRALGL